LHADGSSCTTPTRGDCRCGCYPGYKYCPDHFGGACVSQGAPVC
jgi:hypothetical protein